MLLADTSCKALLRYARALADVGLSDVISVPVVGESGATVLSHVLIGPASQFYSVPALSVPADPRDDAFVRDLEGRTEQLHPSRPAWPDEMIDIEDIDAM